MPTATETLRFALRQGPLRGLLQAPVHIVEPAPTTSTIPPLAARGATGRPLPFGTADLLAAVPFPAGRVTTPPPATAAPTAAPATTTTAAVAPTVSGGAAGSVGVFGHVLVTAFGLQRREPSNPANDHRVTASVRSRFPVHVLVVPDAGPAGYLDVYRHAVVDLAVPDAVLAGSRPGPGDVTVVLAGRHTDFPDGYGVLRCALADLEVGLNLRSLAVAGQLFGVAVTARTGGPALTAAARLLAATGPGSWSAPVVVTLHGIGGLPASVPLGDPERAWAPWPAGDPGLAELASIVDDRYPVPGEPEAPALAIPERDGTGRSWARVLWDRSSGRVPAPLTGFSARPVDCPPDAVDDVLGWARVPAPTGTLRAVADRVRLRVVAQRGDGTEDPGLFAALERAFGYPLSATNDCALRHAAMVCVWSVDLAALIHDLGPAAWGLMQVWCGWAAHGVTLAAAARRMFARPARSFDEHLVAAALRLPEGETPVFLTLCGRTRYAEPMLDLRT